MRRVLQNRPGSGPVFARQHIAACMAKVQLMGLQETLQVQCCYVTPCYNSFKTY
jgi:hypothetical protein